MSRELTNLIAKRFIARTDVKAIQHASGEYTPDRSKFTREDIDAHLAGTRTFGHYLINKDDECKLFTFDIDLEKTGSYPDGDVYPDPNAERPGVFTTDDLRGCWADRRHPGRWWWKLQLRMVAQKLARTAHEELDIEVAVAYSGSKGLHVYCFTGPVKAAMAREGAKIVLDSCGEFILTRGNNFFKHVNPDPIDGYPNVSIEIYPKQDSLDGKDLGNLLRLPLGRNLKSKDPTFFLDLKAPMGEIAPHSDPVALLQSGNAWL